VGARTRRILWLVPTLVCLCAGMLGRTSIRSNARLGVCTRGERASLSAVYSKAARSTQDARKQRLFEAGLQKGGVWGPRRGGPAKAMRDIHCTASIQGGVNPPRIVSRSRGVRKKFGGRWQKKLRRGALHSTAPRVCVSESRGAPSPGQSS